MAALVDYAAHFWGEKCIGYNVLYENMKKGEETAQELINFLRERISMEDDILKSLGKSLNRTNMHISSNGSFVNAWRLTKGTLELWTDIQTTVLKNLTELSKDVARYQDELTKMRKRTKDVDTLEAINLIQTTTTCLQKAKETYNQRAAEAIQLKNNNKEWNSASTKEYLKVRHKLNKAHDEYRQYMDKYSQIRDIYEEKMLRAARTFQEHDKTHLIQMKRFFIQLAKYLEDGHNAYNQVTADFRQNMDIIDIEEIMLRFIEEKGTGTELPPRLNWTEADELPPDLDIVSGIQSQSSSNSSAIIASSSVPPHQPTVNDLLGLDDTWISAGTNSFFGSTKSSNHITSENCSRVGNVFDHKSGDSDSEQHCEIGHNTGPGQSLNASSISNVPQQISSWLGRQKLPHLRLKKHSASQSSLPTAAAAEGTDPATNIEFSKSYGEVKGGNSFLKRYQKKGIKNSTGDLAQIKPKRANSQQQFNDVHLIMETKVQDPLLEFGPPPPLPLSSPPLIDLNYNADDDFTNNLNNQNPRRNSTSFSTNDYSRQKRWSTDSSSSEDDASNTEFQTSKIRQLQIKPINESQQSKLNVSLDELRSAIGQISLQKSSTFENDPWTSAAPNKTSGYFSQSQGPIRQALTGDPQFHRKLTDDFDLPSSGAHDCSQSSSVFFTGGSIARARPRSHTPLTLGGPKQTFTLSTNRDSAPSTQIPPISSSPSTVQSINDAVIVHKVPVAMAINEFLHVWIKNHENKPEIRIFGTILLSLPTTALPILQNMVDNFPLKFTVQIAPQLKSFTPNQFFDLTNSAQISENLCQFSIEREKLHRFLQEQRERYPQSSFHNVDLLRYELHERSIMTIPLTMKSYWTKLADGQTELRIEYNLDDEFLTANKILQNVTFTTKLAEPNSQILLMNSEPKANLDGKGNIVWDFSEFHKDKQPMGTLKGIFKLSAGTEWIPSNTYIQFQILDSTISGADIRFEDNNNYTLSVFRKKVISGKYFCEPKLII